MNHRHVWVFVLVLVSQTFSKTLWPYPQYITTNNDGSTLEVDDLEFFFEITGASNDILEEAVGRYHRLTFPSSHPSHPQVQVPNNNTSPSPNIVGKLFSLQIYVSSNDDTLVLGADESYTLNIPKPATDNSDQVVAKIVSNTVWGAMRGLETFSQLVDWTLDSHKNVKYIVQSVPISITDFPRFAWRGLLIDTSRHFLSVYTIQRVIDSMEWNKMNVLHWHIVDAESFPLESKVLPTLTEKGAWVYPDAVYTQDTIANLISYAKYRGVRIVAEIDTPGHVYSWGYAYPDITVKCPDTVNSHQDYPWINAVPLDMTNDGTYPIVYDLLGEMFGVFTDDYMHLGGDEVNSACLDEDPNQKAWMASQGMNTSSYDDLVNYYETKILNFAAGKKNAVFWNEVFEATQSDPNMKLPAGTVINVWEQSGATDLMRDIVTDGYYAILSAGWYVDQQIPNTQASHFLWMDTWQDFYLLEPMNGLDDLTTQQQHGIIGGEAWYVDEEYLTHTCSSWGEETDDSQIFGRIFPKASATAERLWSPRWKNDTVDATHRIMEQRCRMLQRGVAASPVRADYCPALSSTGSVDTTTKESFPLWIIILEICTFVAVLLAVIFVVFIRKTKKGRSDYISIDSKEALN